MATESSPPAVRYLTYPEAVTLHIMLMRRLEETHFGVFDRSLVESALARPRQAATVVMMASAWMLLGKVVSYLR